MPPTPRPARGARPLAAAVVLVAVAGLALAVGGLRARPDGPPPVVDACGPAWSTAWEAAAQPLAAPQGLAGGTARMLVTPQVTGSQVRVRLSNAYGGGPLQIGRVAVARAAGAAAVVPGTVTPVGFAGREGVVIPAGGEIVSDPVPLVAEAGVPLAVSAAITAAPPVVTGHAVALETSWLASGDAATDPDGHAFGTALGSWFVLTGLDVLAPRPVDAVVAVGDSITDGVGTAAGTNARWTDALAARLAAAGGPATMAVLNAGISRNELLADVAAGGDAPLARFARDVEQTAGATDVVLHVGTNDIAAGASAPAIEAGLVAFADRVRAAGKRVVLTTITPSTSGAHGTPAAVTVRDAVNSWVRDHGREYADGIVDFAAAVADPADPGRLAPAFDSGDGLHLSAAGYRALAAAIDVHALSGSPCLAGAGPSRIALTGH